MRFRFTLIFLFSILLAGCGVYSFTGRGISGIKTIAVETLDNQTSEFGIREQLTDAIISRILSDRVLSLTSTSNADAILRGVINTINERPLTYRTDESITEYEISITVEISLVKPGASEPIWQSRLTGIGNYPYRTGLPDERKEGIDRAIDRLITDLINKLTSDW